MVDRRAGYVSIRIQGPALEFRVRLEEVPNDFGRIDH